MPSSSTSLHVSNTFKSIQASQPQPTLVSAGAFWGPLTSALSYAAVMCSWMNGKNRAAEKVADGAAATMVTAAAAKGRGVAARSRAGVVKEGAATAAAVAAGRAAAAVAVREAAAMEAENFEREYFNVPETTDERELTREELFYLLPTLQRYNFYNHHCYKFTLL